MRAVYFLSFLCPQGHLGGLSLSPAFPMVIRRATDPEIWGSVLGEKGHGEDLTYVSSAYQVFLAGFGMSAWLVIAYFVLSVVRSLEDPMGEGRAGF